MKAILSFVFILFLSMVGASAQAFYFFPQKIQAPPRQSKIVRQKVVKPKPVELAYYENMGQKSYFMFKKEIKKSEAELPLIFLKNQKQIYSKLIAEKDIPYYHFNNLTQAVSAFLQKMPSYRTLKPAEYRKAQYEFLGLSYVIKRANQISLNIQSDSFIKLHDLLLSQTTSVFYNRPAQASFVDLYWKTYFLSELNYPIDLVANFIDQQQTQLQAFNTDTFTHKYLYNLAKISILNMHYINQPRIKDLQGMYHLAADGEINLGDKQRTQKSYLKLATRLGNGSEAKEVKNELAMSVLQQESYQIINSFSFFELFKLIQLYIGYIFIVWPLEIILIVSALLIFALQAKKVLSEEEILKSTLFQKVCLMFTKSYLGSNVPFFSKVAVSLILFGIGLYFNSARNFLESAMNGF